MALQHVYELAALNPAEMQIRLVSLLPPKSDKSKSLSIKLLVGSLDDTDTALSYCWGDENLRESCLINEVETTITANLAAALYQFQADGKSNERFKFWIDAVCINQSDDVEKSSQVRMMSEIYERAQSTILWLGKSGDNSDLAIDFISDVETSGQSYFDSYDSMIESPVWQALRSLLERQWWSRVWVIQEAMLSKQPWIKCGAKEVAYHKFTQLKTLHERNIYTASDQFTMIRDLWSHCPFAAMFWESWQEWKGKELTFWLTDMGAFQCKMLRDKLYGLLGLISPTAKEMVLRDITVEYKEANKSDREIVIQAAIICFHEDGLVLLQMRQTHKDPALRLPSWTPDWTTYFPNVPFLGFGFDAFPRDCELELPAPDKWIRPEYYKKRFAYLPDREALLLHGFLVDTVDFVDVKPEVPIYIGHDADEMAESKRQRAELTRETCRSWESEVITSKPDSYSGPGEEGCAEAFCRTVIANRNWDKKSIESAVRPVFNTWLDKDLPWNMFSASETEKDAFTQDYRFCAITRCARRSFITTKGGLFGLAPPHTKVGDLVCLLYSGEVAYILNPGPPKGAEPGRFIGEAYVHGIMSGEYLKQSNLPTWSGFWVK